MDRKLQGALALALVCSTGSAWATPGLFSDPGEITFGSDNDISMEIGGTNPGNALGEGIQFSRMVFGTLNFGGLMNVVLIDNFKPQSGQRFDLFDWTSTSGAFDRIDYGQAVLTPGLSWDSSQLYTTGELMVTGVALVPEPGSLALMLAGIGFVGVKLRRRRALQAG